MSPTLGFEYIINEHFSIGGEAEWFYEDLDTEVEQKDPYYGDLRATGDRTSTGTDTRLIVRFSF